VSEALAEGLIAEERWQSYRKLLGEARRHEEMTNPLAADKRKRWIRQVHRRMRQMYKERR
jgi:hypothetical protein